ACATPASVIRVARVVRRVGLRMRRAYPLATVEINRIFPVEEDGRQPSWAAAGRPFVTTRYQRRADAASTATVQNMRQMEQEASSQPWKLCSLRKLFTVDK